MGHLTKEGQSAEAHGLAGRKPSEIEAQYGRLNQYGEGHREGRISVDIYQSQNGENVCYDEAISNAFCHSASAK